MTEKKEEIVRGSDLKNEFYGRSLYYKREWVRQSYLINDKRYIVIVSEWEDSEGWCYRSTDIIGDYPELDKMIEDVKFEEAVNKEVEKRIKENFEERKEKYEKMPHEELVKKVLELEEDIKRAFNRL